MKKIVILLLSLLLLAGCKDKKSYEDYEHYTKEEIETETHTDDLGCLATDVLYVELPDEEGTRHNYALGKIPGSDKAGFGIFYQLDEDDYILIGTFSKNSETPYPVAYGNKLIANEGEILTEYTLNGAEIEVKKTDLDPFSKIFERSNPRIQSIHNGYVYFTSGTKCFLSTYHCELND